MLEAISLTPNEYAKLKRHSGYYHWKPRLISVNGKKMRVASVDVIGVYYHRGPKVLCLVKPHKDG